MNNPRTNIYCCNIHRVARECGVVLLDWKHHSPTSRRGRSLHEPAALEPQVNEQAAEEPEFAEAELLTARFGTE